ncbi:expressed protein [Echinococcus multilocularis]|uniref:Expressed protein n=1 Tax=Echinococcus multilocularis TaxID=6211 RepID=A0A087VXP8_ECHMU|nr:expressed protein [Echinococcus multilocularis]
MFVRPSRVRPNVSGPPPPEDSARVPLPGAGMGMMGIPPPGMGRAVGRGMPLATPGAAIPPPAAAPPTGLAGPAWGVGVPAPGLMQPQGSTTPATTALLNTLQLSTSITNQLVILLFWCFYISVSVIQNGDCISYKRFPAVF